MNANFINLEITKIYMKDGKHTATLCYEDPSEDTQIKNRFKSIEVPINIEKENKAKPSKMTQLSLPLVD